MRRRWSWRLSRGRRDMRPARAAIDHERRQRRLLVLVSALLAVALWATLSIRLPVNTGVRAGSPSPIDVRAQRSMTYISELLTEQERILLGHISEGLTNRQIAEQMFLAEKTVKNYVSSILSKLGLERRTQAAVLASKLLGGPQR